jgi:hypothetical protein
MKNFVIILSLILFSNFPASAQENKTPAGDIIRVEAKNENGFSYPYYLFVPSELRDEKARKQTHTILVLPNNTGKLNDSLEFHEADVLAGAERTLREDRPELLVEWSTPRRAYRERLFKFTKQLEYKMFQFESGRLAPCVSAERHSPPSWELGPNYVLMPREASATLAA